MDESFLAEIDNHCQLEINVDTSYCIVKSKDLPEDFVVEPVYEDSENGRFTFFCVMLFIQCIHLVKFRSCSPLLSLLFCLLFYVYTFT